MGTCGSREANAQAARRRTLYLTRNISTGKAAFRNLTIDYPLDDDDLLLFAEALERGSRACPDGEGVVNELVLRSLSSSGPASASAGRRLVQAVADLPTALTRLSLDTCDYMHPRALAALGRLGVSFLALNYFTPADANALNRSVAASHTHTLKLAHCTLRPNSWSIVGPHLCDLRVYDCHMPRRSVGTVFRRLFEVIQAGKTPSLTRLAIGKCSLSDDEMVLLMATVQSPDVHLEHLELRLSLRPDLALVLGQSLSGVPSLTSFDFSGNCLMSPGGSGVGEGLVALKNKITGVSLSQASLGGCLATVSMSLASCHLLASLDLSHNKLTADDVSGLIASLRELEALRDLNLGACGLTSESISLLWESLPSSLDCLTLSSNRYGPPAPDVEMPPLKTLRLNNCFIGSPLSALDDDLLCPTVFSLIQALPFDTLDELDLSFNRLFPGGCYQLCQVLSSKSRDCLSSVNLSYCGVCSIGLMELSSLKTTRLQVDGNEIDTLPQQGFEHVTELSLKNNPVAEIPAGSVTRCDMRGCKVLQSMIPDDCDVYIQL